MKEYIETSINPADYIEVWEVEDAEHGKQLVMAVDDLKYLPPADVRPVVRGEWIAHNYLIGRTLFDENEVYVCSCCNIQKTKRKYYYFPNCGADMRGGDAE